MLDAEVVSELLEAVADEEVARKRAREVRTLRGVRGVAFGEVARIAAAVWADARPSLDDEGELAALFATAFEDGLVAIGLLAALLPDAPDEAFDLARDWLSRVDDVATADALGWLVLGPGALAAGGDPVAALGGAIRGPHPTVRRAAVMAGMAWLPIEIEGPAAAPLRARIGTAAVRFVDHPQTRAVAALLRAALRDEDPAVRKAVRRLLSAWAEHDPDAATRFLAETPGGVPKMLREACEKAARRGRRLASREDSP
jgi:hypothetical protein